MTDDDDNEKDRFQEWPTPTIAETKKPLPTALERKAKQEEERRLANDKIKNQYNLNRNKGKHNGPNSIPNQPVPGNRPAPVPTGEGIAPVISIRKRLPLLPSSIFRPNFFPIKKKRDDDPGDGGDGGPDGGNSPSAS